jgi:hypothetical protein
MELQTLAVAQMFQKILEKEGSDLSCCKQELIPDCINGSNVMGMMGYASYVCIQTGSE